jgi:uncharacterized protein YutE (UPF0331/DUF86 family)
MSDELSASQLSRLVTAVETIETSLGVLVEKRPVDRATYKRDSDVQDVVERRFVKMTEAALDIGAVLLAHERGQPVDSNPGTMRVLADAGVVRDDTAAEMANAARFRNVLAHTYGDVIDHDVVYDALHDLERYRAFVHEIRSYLESIDALDA